MKKIFSFLCLIAAIVVAMSACSSTKEEKGTSETGNAALDNIFARKSVRTYLNKGVEKEKIDLMLRAGIPSCGEMQMLVSDRRFPDAVDCALDFEHESLFELNRLCHACSGFKEQDFKKLGAVCQMAKPACCAIC